MNTDVEFIVTYQDIQHQWYQVRFFPEAQREMFRPAAMLIRFLLKHFPLQMETAKQYPNKDFELSATTEEQLKCEN